MSAPSTHRPDVSISPRILDKMRKVDGCLYLASPYTGYRPAAAKVPDEALLGEAAYRAAYASGVLYAHGVHHYCPIVSSHWPAMAAGMDPRDHTFWMPHCYAHMRECKGIVVLMLPGWRSSKGVTEERRWFASQHLPEILWSPPDNEF